MLKCRICFEQASPAVVTRCGHVFCRGHIEEWLKNETTCPLCRRTISKVSLIPLFLDEEVPSTQGSAGSKTGSGGNANARSTIEEETGQIGRLLKTVQKEWNRHIFDRAKLSSTVTELRSENKRLKEQLTSALIELDTVYATTSARRHRGGAAHHSMEDSDEDEDDALVRTAGSKTARGRSRGGSNSSSSNNSSSSRSSSSSNSNSSNNNNNSSSSSNSSSGVRAAESAVG